MRFNDGPRSAPGWTALALRYRRRSDPPATPRTIGASQTPQPAQDARGHRPARRRRGLRDQRVGIVVYVEMESHHTPQRLALDNRCSLQDPCTSAVMKLVTK